MSKTHAFSGVTQAMLERIRATSGDAYAVDLDPGGTAGTVRGQSSLGDVVVRFSYAAELAEVTLTILKKPMLLPSPLLWAGFSHALHRARRELDTP